MAEIVAFPTDTMPTDKMPTNTTADIHQDVSNDRFLLDEGLDLLADFRLIQDEEVRASLRKLVKSMAAASPDKVLAEG